MDSTADISVQWRREVVARASEVELRAEVLALRRQVQVLERQIKRVRWEPGDRLILAALRERLPRSAWAGLLVRPETVLSWHRELVRRRGAAYTRRPRIGRPPLARMAKENPGWGYFPRRWGKGFAVHHPSGAGGCG